MAVDDEKSKDKAQAGVEGPRKLDRRDVLKGLSTVPALGLFGYAWQQQRRYQQAKLEEAAQVPAAAAGLQEVNVALHRRRRAGPGADRRDAPHSRPALPRGVRHLGRNTTRSASSTR